MGKDKEVGREVRGREKRRTSCTKIFFRF